MSLTTQQLRLIHVAKAKLSLDDVAYRAVLANLTGKASAKDLNQAEFDAVLAHFEQLGLRRADTFERLGYRPGMATPNQLRYIVGLWRKYTGRSDEAALNHWLENKFAITHMRFASRQTAQQAITALKAMVGRSPHGSNRGKA